MLLVVIKVASFAFQLAGGIMLLLWSLGNCEDLVKEKSLDSGGPNWIEFDGTEATTTVSKNTLHKHAKEVYSNVVAFINLIIGYGCAIFVQETDLCAWCVFFLVAILTVAIIKVENFCIDRMIRQKFPYNKTYRV